MKINQKNIHVFIVVLITCCSILCSASTSANTNIPKIARCGVSSGVVNDGPPGIKALVDYVGYNLFIKTKELQEVIDSWKKPGCVLADGRPKMTALLPGLNSVVGSDPYNQIPGALKTIHKRFPRSSLVALAEAQYWYAYAWAARGNGVASTVTPQGWKLFKQRLIRADQVLINAKPYASDLPAWYQETLKIEFQLNFPPKKILGMFSEGVRRYKLYYPNYFTMVDFLMPKWGGNWNNVDNFANWSVKYTRPELGNAMYARVYWDVYENMWEKRKFFKKTKVSWKKMKASFRTIEQQSPNSYWVLNNFAKFACLAGDGNTFLSLRKKIGTHIMHNAWDQQPIELCEEKFSLQDRNTGDRLSP